MVDMKKKWFITISIFLIIQLIFFVIDGTRFEPRLNDSGNIISRYAHWVTDLKLFTEWWAIYTYPYFNLVTFIFISVIIINLIADFISFKNKNSTS